ncbi:MAG: redoxin domain-containing protein [Gemmatimonadaceae bacterium]|nr:redoxin domain-containing protein [Gemmatimonadaceae bacterium]
MRLPSRALARQAATALRASRAGRRLIVLSLGCALWATREVEAWSRTGTDPRTPDAVVDALARSFVGRPIDSRHTGVFRAERDFPGPAVIFAYYSIEDEYSHIMLRDLSWLSERFAERGLRVVAIALDDTSHLPAIRRERKVRGYPFEWLLDTEGHASALQLARPVPMAFLFVGDTLVRRSFSIVQEQGRTIWGSMRVQMQLHELLPSATP